MGDTPITVVGNVASDVLHKVTETGVSRAVFRVASTARKWDPARNDYVDRGTVFFTVTCWRRLADSVQASVQRGQPVVVTGRLRQYPVETTAGERLVTEIEAGAVGHDLSRGTAQFVKAPSASRAVTGSDDPASPAPATTAA